MGYSYRVPYQQVKKNLVTGIATSRGRAYSEASLKKERLFEPLD